jgi:hypothetical protein
MAWEIVGLLPDETPPGLDGQVWAWEIRRGKETRKVRVEVSRTAIGEGEHGLNSETVEAVRTEGRSAVERILDRDDPPERLRFHTHGGPYEDE